MTTVLDTIGRWLIHEFQRTGFTWDTSIARYRDRATGQLVSESTVLDTVEGFATYAQRNMSNITQQYLDGKIDIKAWQQGMRQEIKDAHLVGAMAGRGGRDAMTQADWGRQGARLRQQYGYLDGLAWERVGGEVSDAQMMARARMYANKARTSYYDGQTAANEAAEFTEERRVLNPAEHCDDCIGWANIGWAAIGKLPEPGEASVCRANCKCNKEYR